MTNERQLVESENNRGNSPKKETEVFERDERGPTVEAGGFLPPACSLFLRENKESVFYGPCGPVTRQCRARLGRGPE